MHTEPEISLMRLYGYGRFHKESKHLTNCLLSKQDNKIQFVRSVSMFKLFKLFKVYLLYCSILLSESGCKNKKNVMLCLSC